MTTPPLLPSTYPSGWRSPGDPSQPAKCPSVYPPSAEGPYSDETGVGWSGPMRCVLSPHDHDQHIASGIVWGGAPGVRAGTVCGTFGCERFAVLHVRRPHEWISGFYCAEHGADGTSP